MKKVLVLVMLLAAASRAFASDECVEVSYVEKPGPNFQIFLDTLESALENRCHGEAANLIDFEFSAKKKGEFEVTIHHVPPDCETFGRLEPPDCDPYEIPRCYSIGTSTLIPNPESAKKLAMRVAKKINDGEWHDVGCEVEVEE